MPIDMAALIDYYNRTMWTKIIKSLMIWVIGISLTVLLYFVMLFFSVILFPFDKWRKVAHAQCFWWSDAVIALNPYWQIDVSGLDNIDHKKTYVIVSNHQSLADIVIMYQTKMQFKWVAKESLFKIPFLGWSLSLAKHIKLSRGNFSSIKKVYRESASWLKKGVSVLFFPEGTRSLTEEMGDFQNGAFKLAIKEKVPILAVYLEGTGNAIPKGDWRFKTKVLCSLKVLPAVDTSQFKPEEFSRLKDLVRLRMKEASAPRGF